MAWQQYAVVVRSECHDATWIGHVEHATYENTPAGPLRVVKAAVEVMLQHDLDGVGDQPYTTRWVRGSDADTWVYEEFVPDAARDGCEDDAARARP